MSIVIPNKYIRATINTITLLYIIKTLKEHTKTDKQNKPEYPDYPDYPDYIPLNNNIYDSRINDFIDDAESYMTRNHYVVDVSEETEPYMMKLNNPWIN
jgi:uncharacterized protein (DUF1499 family)